MNARHLQYAALVLVIGGFGSLGAGAGAQATLVIFGDAVGCLNALGPAPDGCRTAIDAAQTRVLVFFGAGIVSMLAGGGVLWGVQND